MRLGDLNRIRAEMAQVLWGVDAGKAKNELGWVAIGPGDTLEEPVRDLRERGIVWSEE